MIAQRGLEMRILEDKGASDKEALSMKDDLLKLESAVDSIVRRITC